MKPKNPTAVKVILLVVYSGCLAIWPPKMLSAAPPIAQAEIGKDATEEDFDSLLDQFDDDEALPEGTSAAATPPQGASSDIKRPYHISGEFSLNGTWNFAHDPPVQGQTDWRGLSRLRSMLALEFDVEASEILDLHASGYGFYDFAYTINDREQYTDQVLDTYEQELELTETYALLNPVPSIDFRFGRQIVVWGSSDNIRVTDILNPLDLREPGLTDLEYIRLPVTMSRLDYYLDQWRLSGMAIHEIRFDKNPAFGSDYFSFPAPLPPEEKPASSGGNTEWAVSVSGTFSGWDVTFYAADHFNDQAHLEALPTVSGLTVLRRHASLKMLGAAASVAVGNWLFKSEAAWQDGLEYFSAPGETFSRFDLLFGLEYSGITETTISVEVANRHINGFQDRLQSPPDQAQQDTLQSAIRLVREFMNDTLTCTLLAMTYGPLGQDGAFQRLQVDYDLRDNLVVSGGVIFYQSGDRSEMQNIADSNRLFTEIAYHF